MTSSAHPDALFDEIDMSFLDRETPFSGGTRTTPWTAVGAEGARAAAPGSGSSNLRGTLRNDNANAAGGGDGGGDDPDNSFNMGSTVESNTIKEEKRTEIKLFLKDLPENVAEYRRYYVKAAVVSAGEDPEIAQEWIEVVEDDAVLFPALVTPKTHSCKKLDVRLFVCVLGSIKGKHSKWAVVIETRCQFGSGRQALRILDRAFVQHGERLAMSSTTEMMGLKCSDMGQVEETLVTFDTLRGRVPSMSDTIVLEILRRMLKGVPRCDQIMSLHLMKPPVDTEALLVDLRKAAADWKFDKELDSTGKKKHDNHAGVAPKHEREKGKKGLAIGRRKRWER